MTSDVDSAVVLLSLPVGTDGCVAELFLVVPRKALNDIVLLPI